LGSLATGLVVEGCAGGRGGVALLLYGCVLEDLKFGEGGLEFAV